MSAVMKKGGFKPGETREIKRKRGGVGKQGNSGPAGGTKPAKRHYRALADMAARAGVVNGVRKSKRAK